MKKQKSSIGFTILLILILFVYAVVLELSQNTILGWIILVGLTVLFLLLRRTLRKKESWKAPVVLLSWAVFLVLLAGNLKLTEPPYRTVPATDQWNPKETEVVTVAQGDLTGVYNKDQTVKIYAGIPYAAPPVGELRWKEPQAPEKWDGVRSCDRFAPMAMQQQGSVFYDSLQHILGYHDYRVSFKDNYREAASEDCLYLNVWAPADWDGEPLPVLFYIHGGSLMTGHTSNTEHQGEDLAKRGIIFVSCAYRLGVFGYYANEELAAESDNGTTGDYGLLDQIAALKWVNENIAAFGGDPERITIAGESAGASSVNAVCVSPLSEGFFSQAIAESSGIVAKHPYHTFREAEEALAMGHEIMDEMGVSSVAELREIPAEELVRTKYQNSAMMVDGYAIMEQPYLTYERGANHEQALLNGFNAKEADAFLLDTEATAENYEELLKPVLGDYAKEAAELVPAGFVQRDQAFIIDAGGEAKGALDVIYSAAWFSYSHHIWSNYTVSNGIPTYEYYFTKTNNSLSNYHAGEIPYAYGNLWRHEWVYEDSDFALSDQMQQYWVNFVKTGDPNGEGLPIWELRKLDRDNVLELGDEIRMTEDPNHAIYRLLDKYQADML